MRLASRVLLAIAFPASPLLAHIDSGGGAGMAGSQISHASVGAPFATHSATAGLIDILYPLDSSTDDGGSTNGGGNQGTLPGPVGPSAPSTPSTGGASAAQSPGKSKSAKKSKSGSKKSSAKSSKKSADKSSKKKSDSKKSQRKKK